MRHLLRLYRCHARLRDEVRCASCPRPKRFLVLLWPLHDASRSLGPSNVIGTIIACDTNDNDWNMIDMTDLENSYLVGQRGPFLCRQLRVETFLSFHLPETLPSSHFPAVRMFKLTKSS
ncbi:hypothetical protein MPTK1_4g23230 [Marchantia polymorpha subsp. ruderalis]|uniref:Uncharacterized protein n=2 Tax=Marchantia polymorpha TaxID=3197 RepID=A0AAF6BCW8_MARPO|nr:hypothetical protein MARPO_0020s0087 [Marchantia polymorpha]BBN09852.1 hypothetical protein Mp_4g23230 [Marchantia polymorpha subsp. ruderalis]|eukprot:PTQ44430.1 hypothetical protein MARPO_0020s0087 [Marchantia polymorpha]